MLRVPARNWSGAPAETPRLQRICNRVSENFKFTISKTQINPTQLSLKAARVNPPLLGLSYTSRNLRCVRSFCSSGAQHFWACGMSPGVFARPRFPFLFFHSIFVARTRQLWRIVPTVAGNSSKSIRIDDNAKREKKISRVFVPSLPLPVINTLRMMFLHATRSFPLTE